MIESSIAEQFQVFLDNSSILDIFQFGFRPSYGAEMVLPAFVDALSLAIDKSHVSLFVLHGFICSLGYRDNAIPSRYLEAEVSFGNMAQTGFK